MEFKIENIETDILIIGGGTAGCYAAITLGDISDKKVLIVDKANIKRSGCLAAGVNAINGYLNNGESEESYLNNVIKEGASIVREDLVYSIGENLNKVTTRLEEFGVPILKDEKNKYIARGKRSIKINGENIKVILSNEVKKRKNIKILNNLNIVDYIIKENRVIGAIGFSVKEDIFYLIYSKGVICTTGGASGIYKPNNPGFSKHKMWYSPFNTGGGYAMGIRAGAEMTTFEMRFIALRCKDTIAPTGTIAQGLKARQVNRYGEEYINNYGENITSIRLYSTIEENKKERGPCYLKTVGIEGKVEKDLYKSYLNMAPSQTLKWIDNGSGPRYKNVEISGTEPYIVGGHSASGYWVDINRSTTIKGLYAGGDVVGGSPKKYVTGALVEGEIAAKSVLKYIEEMEIQHLNKSEISKLFDSLFKFRSCKVINYKINEIEEEMQDIMDKYAGGISTFYEYTNNSLKIAEDKIDKLLEESNLLKAEDNYELMLICELIDRLYVAKVLIKHMKARKETRWRSYGENRDYPNIDNNYLKYVNSVYRDKKVEIIYRDIVKKGELYEHTN
jgi:adenylylsulfate reductase, subunit A